jgi:hypothetical protein
VTNAQVVETHSWYTHKWWWDGFNMQLHGGTGAICSCMVGRMQYAAAWWDGCNMQLHGGTDAICSCMVGRMQYAAAWWDGCDMQLLAVGRQQQWQLIISDSGSSTTSFDSTGCCACLCFSCGSRQCQASAVVHGEWVGLG